MASIYSGTTGGGMSGCASSITYRSSTSATTTKRLPVVSTTRTAAATGELDLSDYLYVSANETNFARIRSEIDQYITSRISSGLSTGSWISGSWISDTEYENGVFSIDNLTFNSEETKKALEKERKIQKIKSNLLIKVKSRVPSRQAVIPENEQVAIETLRESITEKEFRKYLKYGFVLVNGKGGKTYQVFKNRLHTKVWKGGQVIEEICVHLKDWAIPPTDHVIAFRTMIQADEEAFRKLGNVYNMRKAA